MSQFIVVLVTSNEKSAHFVNNSFNKLFPGLKTKLTFKHKLFQINLDTEFGAANGFSSIKFHEYMERFARRIEHAYEALPEFMKEIV